MQRKTKSLVIFIYFLRKSIKGSFCHGKNNLKLITSLTTIGFNADNLNNLNKTNRIPVHYICQYLLSRHCWRGIFGRMIQAYCSSLHIVYIYIYICTMWYRKVDSVSGSTYSSYLNQNKLIENYLENACLSQGKIGKYLAK